MVSPPLGQVSPLSTPPPLRRACQRWIGSRASPGRVVGREVARFYRGDRSTDRNGLEKIRRKVDSSCLGVNLEFGRSVIDAKNFPDVYGGAYSCSAHVRILRQRYAKVAELTGSGFTDALSDFVGYECEVVAWLEFQVS